MENTDEALASLKRVIELNFEDGDILFLSAKRKGPVKHWEDRGFIVGKETISEISGFLAEFPYNTCNIYFCPLPFDPNNNGRKAQFFLGSKYLWADIDQMDPQKLVDLGLTPTLLWESSPGRYQGLWRVSDTRLPPGEAEELNKDLTYYIGADKGGWDTTQVLRVPGTRNLKYPDSPKVGSFQEGPTYTVKQVRDIVAGASTPFSAPVTEEKADEEIDFTGWEKLDHKAVFKKYENKLPINAKDLIRATDTGGKDRSDILFSIERFLAEAGASPAETLAIVHKTAWNKFSDRRSGIAQLKREIKKARIKTEEKVVVEKQLESEERKKKLITKEELLEQTKDADLRFEFRYPKDHFITKYLNHNKRLTDAYLEYHHGAAITLLSIAVHRRAVIPLSSGPVYPNTWSFLLGHSTISRKTTAVNKAREIAGEIFSFGFIAQSFSPESLLEIMSETPQGWLIKDEAASFLSAMKKSYMSEMRDIFCELYDCKGFTRKLRSGNKKTKTEFIIADPYMTQLMATTPENLSENSIKLDLTSGWLLRFLFYFPTYYREWKPLREMTAEEAKDEALLKGELKVLNEFFATLPESLQFTPSKEANEYFIDWQKKEEKRITQTHDEVEAGAYGRLSIYVLKLSMLYTIGGAGFLERARKAIKDKGKIIIGLEETRWACEEVENYFIPVLKQIYGLIAIEDTRNNQKKIIHLLETHGGTLTRAFLFKRLRTKPRDFEDDISSLKQSKEVEERITDDEKGDTIYVLRKE